MNIQFDATSGHQVKDLTRSLENQLADQKPPKLAGSVNTINTAYSLGTHTSLKSVSKKKEKVEDAKVTIVSLIIAACVSVAGERKGHVPWTPALGLADIRGRHCFVFFCFILLCFVQSV